MSPRTHTQKPAKSATVNGKAVTGFTDEERAAMKARAQELKAEARRSPRAKPPVWRSASARYQAHAVNLNVARVTAAGCAQRSQFLGSRHFDDHFSRRPLGLGIRECVTYV